MKKVFLLLAASLFGMAAIAGPLGVTYSEGDITKLSVPYNQWGSGDEWQGGEAAGNKILKDAVLEAGDDSTSWVPAIGDAFVINMTGITNFTGVIRLGIIDEREDVGYWQDWGSFGACGIAVNADEEFTAEFVIDITKNEATNFDKPDLFGMELTSADLIVLCKMPGQDNTTFTGDAIIELSTFEVEYIKAVVYEEPYMVLSSIGEDVISGQYKYHSYPDATGVTAAKAGQYVNVTFSGKSAQDLESVMYTLLDGSEGAGWWLPLSKDMALFAVNVKKGQEINAAFSWKLDTDPTEEPVFKNVFLANSADKYAKAVFEAYSLTVTVTDAPKYGVGAMNFVKDVIVYQVLNDKEVEVVSFLKPYTGEIVIPQTVDTYSVTSIGGGAFSGCSDLTSVTIPNSVTSIGYEAFRGCSGLTSVTIPNSVTSIGGSAFYGCRGLTSVTIPNSVTSIGDYAFCGCSGLTSVTIPNSVTSIGDYAFYNCGLTSITIPESLDVSDAGIYFTKEGIRYHVLDVKEVEVAPNSYTGDIVIPSAVTAGNTFSVTSIGEIAFYGCSGLTSVTIPNSVTSIGMDAFAWSGLTSVTIPESLDVSDAGIYFTKEGIRYYVLDGKEVEVAPNSYTGDIVIPSAVTAGNTFSVTSIGEYAFYDCSGLTSITIPNSVTSIGVGAFSDCTALSKVTCYAVNPPDADASLFSNYNAYLTIPCDNFEAYDIHPVWGSFKHVDCISGEATELQKDEVVVEPEISEAVFSMPTNASANSYTLTIQNNGVTFCTLTFNSQGQLSNIDFSGNTLKAAVEGYQFTVTGLSAATGYNYSFKALDKSKSVLKEYTGSFTTKNADGTGGSSEGGGSGEGGSGQGGNEGEQGSGYTITVLSANEVLGTVYGEGSYEANTVVTIIAIPERGNQFVAWNDGNTDNPRKVVATKNATYIASFESNPKTDISNMDNSVAISIVNNQIFVNGEAPEFVITSLGQKVANQSLKAGIYFVVVEGQSVKASIR